MKVASVALMVEVFLASISFAGRPTPMGQWGGRHIDVEVRDLSSQVELDCAHGTISERFLIHKHGQFDLRGVFVEEQPGPIDITVPPKIHPARYIGNVRGDAMRLTIVLTDTGDIIGPFLLTHGVPGFVVKCL